MNSRKIKICWLTATYFLDVDIPIVPQLQKEYDIDWIILTTLGNRDGDRKLIEMTGCRHYELVVNKGMFISPRKILFYKRLIKRMVSSQF